MGFSTSTLTPLLMAAMATGKCSVVGTATISASSSSSASSRDRFRVRAHLRRGHRGGLTKRGLAGVREGDQGHVVPSEQITKMVSAHRAEAREGDLQVFVRPRTYHFVSRVVGCRVDGCRDFLDRADDLVDLRVSQVGTDRHRQHLGGQPIGDR